MGGRGGGLSRKPGILNVVKFCSEQTPSNSFFGCILLEYPEKRHCCSCIVYAWIPTVSGGHPSGEGRGPLDVWASVATHSSVFNTDDDVQLP